MTTANMLMYGLVALGAVGIYLLLPKPGKSTWVAGLLLGLAALAGVVVVAVSRAAPDSGVGGYFYLFALIALVCATGVITQRQAVYSALFFVIVVLSVAGLMVLMGAEFLAAALIIVYAGAILVTYVFVIMLASQTGESLYDRRARAPLAACLAGFVLVGTVGGAVAEYASGADMPAIAAAQPATAGEVQAAAGNTESLGAQLMTRYMLVLEVAGVLLLLAMVGAIAIARKRFPGDREVGSAERPEIGEVGRTAAPY